MPADGMIETVVQDTSATIGESRGTDRFTVNFGLQLPEFDTVGARAFAAHDPSEPEGRYYALIGQIEVPRRQHIIDALMTMPANRILTPEYDGVLEIEPGKIRTVTVLPMPGPRVLEVADGSQRLTDTVIRRLIVPQLSEALNELRVRNITHRDIRIDNLFWRDDRKTQIVLGECFSSPAGMNQPMEAELQGRFLCHRAGRGEGALPSDIAAMGYLVLTLLLGKLPSFDMNGNAFAAERAGRGTGTLYLDNLQTSATIINLLRGMLIDEPSGQWQPDQIKQWSGGSEPGTRAVNQLDQFLRPCKFNENLYVGRRALARAFAMHPKAAGAFVITEAFMKFVQNGMSDAGLTDRIRALLNSGVGRTNGAEILVTKIRFALDPSAPVLIDLLEVMSDGIGPALAMAFALGDDQMLASIQRGFANGLFAIALEFEHATLANVRERRTQIASIAGYCKGDRGQTGLERALYDLNPDLACQSPLIRDYCARSVKDLMIALDRVAAGGKVKGTIFDRHVEGFIAARCGGSESRIDLIARAHGDAIEELIAQVRIFEALQSTRYRGALKGLTAYYAEQLRDVLLKLKNKSRRDSALMRLDVLAQSGSFVEISRGLDLKTLRERDAAEYRNAILGFLKNANFVENLRMGVQPGEPKALEMGGKAVAIVAHAILGFSAMVNFMRLFL